MSLVRLLTAGRTLVGHEHSPSRYRMRSKNPLPKFGSGRNPFVAPTPAPEPIPQPVVGEMTPAELAAARLKETKRLPTAATIETKANPNKPGAIAFAWTWLSRWAQKLYPRGWRSARKPKAESASPFIPRFKKSPFSRSPVQGELSLDQIKVLRNDLSEADVEIGPVRPASKAGSRPVEPTREPVELAEARSF